MDGKIHILLLLSVSVFACCRASKYNLFPKAKSWYEAQSFCRKECVDLVTVDGMTQMEALLDMFQGQYEDALWIGLSKGTLTARKWQWSLADERFYKDGERTYFKWGMPDTDRNCVYLRNGLMYEDDCTTNYYAVCFDESKQGVEQYVLTTTLFYWHHARDGCRANYTDLASVRNAAESQIISDLAGGASVWIGLFRDFWTWSDNSASSFRFFPLGTHPYTLNDSKCIAVLKGGSGRWVERSCEQQLPFICHCPRSSMAVKVALGSVPGLDMNDPAAQQNVIKQMEQLLNQANLSGAVSLRWVKKSDGKVFEKKTVKKKKEDCRKL